MADKFDYNEAALDAAEQIEFWGQAGQAVKQGNASGWDSSGNVIPAQPDVTIDGTVTPLLKYKQSEIDGNHILTTDSFVLFDSSTAPEIDMMITINGDTFRIKSLKVLSSVDGINVLRKLQLRK